MPILVECPSCHSKMQVKDEHAGRRGRCSSCKTVFAVSAPSQAAAAAESGAPGRASEPDRARPVDHAPAPKVPAAGQPAQQEEECESYALADGGPRKVKPRAARADQSPSTGPSAQGVREAAAPTRKTLSAAQILGAFGAAIEPFRPTALYRLWIVIVAGVMVLLPVLYVGLIGLVAAGMMYHAGHNVTLFQTLGGRHGGGSARLAAMIYLGPLIAGAVALGFMFKPLFARPARAPARRALEPEAEPLLFAFVDGVCGSVAAPRPARIEVDCEVNASARLEGSKRLGQGNELVLTIGLPLAAGLSLKQLAGVLAHEFGHFAQGAGMRLSMLIWRINYWFARVVYERDEWDVALASWSSGKSGIYLAALAGLARLAVWLTRRVLWALMSVGHIVSCVLMRQMEYDADRYSARLVGGETFADTSWRFQEISLAARGAYADLRSSWEQRRLPENFPKLVVANVPQIPAAAMTSYREAAARARTRLFDTHPSDKDRAARARAEAPGDGVFHLEGPATDAFGDFDALARDISFRMYKSQLGPEISENQLFSVSELVESQAATQEGLAALRRFFLGLFNSRRLLPLPAELPRGPLDPAAARQSLVEARRAQQAACDAARQALAAEDESLDRLYTAEAALVLMNTENPIRAAEFNLTAATPAVADAARRAAREKIQALEELYQAIARAAAERLAQDLTFLEADAICDRIPDGRALRDEARSLYPCVAHLGGSVAPQVQRTCGAAKVLHRIASVYTAGNNEDNPRMDRAIRRACTIQHEQLEQLHRKVGDALYYPFEHASDEISLARFAFPTGLPRPDEIGRVWEAVNDIVPRIDGLYFRAIGRLALAAEAVERLLKLPPLEDSGSQATGESSGK
jgi:predicted Zn finger-like uncharacterized protein